MSDTKPPPAAAAEEKAQDFVLLKVELETVDVLSSITRSLIVPRKATLGWIHAVIQVAMGWTNSHLHQFRVDGDSISDPDFELQGFEDDPPVRDETVVTLGEVLDARPTSLTYEYDFGDSWNHFLYAEALPQGSAPVAKRAVCVAGARACPPEDCGGIGGYEELLAALSNRRHPEHRSMKEWLGRPFDPAAFSIEDTNRFLDKLRWPKVSSAALAKVLMARDGMQGG